jgi:hypothetical protein
LFAIFLSADLLHPILLLAFYFPLYLYLPLSTFLEYLFLEERKNLDEEKQRTAGEKLNEELIDLALKLQDIGKQRKVAKY